LVFVVVDTYEAVDIAPPSTWRMRSTRMNFQALGSVANSVVGTGSGFVPELNRSISVVNTQFEVSSIRAENAFLTIVCCHSHPKPQHENHLVGKERN
jgi:hypothetical protein